jgi:hypothetical protein
MEIAINYWAVLMGGIASMIVGGLWYGPLFGKIWQRESGITDEMMAGAKTKGVAKSYIFMFIFALISTYILAHFIAIQEVTSIAGALSLALWAWLGFQVPIHIGSVLWDMKSMKLFMINALYSIVTLMISGIIIVSML